MATRANLTVNDVLNELDGNAEYEGDSEDDFDGYVDTVTGDREEEPVEVSANEEVGAEVGPEEMDVCDSGDSEETDTLPEYTLVPGCAIPVEGNRPLEYFTLLMTDDMLQNIVTQTNLNAQQYIESHDIPPHSRVRRWSKFAHDLSELKKFFAIIILMGLVRYPEIESHWAIHWPFTNSHCSSVSVLKRHKITIPVLTHTYTFTLRIYSCVLRS